MNATGQQLSGGAKYSSATRIGNWYEEISLADAKVRDFKKRSESGSLNLRRLESKIMKCTQSVPHSFSVDGMLKFGDSIMLAHMDTSYVLACDPYEDQDIGKSRFLVSSSNQSMPVARNVFTIVRPTQNQMNLSDDPDDTVLRYGQAFMLRCNDSLLFGESKVILDLPLYLSSIKKSTTTSTKETNRQMVFMSPDDNCDAVWICQKPSYGRVGATDRYLSEGTAVNVEDILLFVHRQTNCCLATDSRKVEMTEFGVEYECYADRTSGSGKIGLMSSEFKGECTVNTLAKPDASKYYWKFLVSDNPEIAEDTRNLPPPVSMDILFDQMRSFAKSRGVESWLGLRAQLAFTDRLAGIGDGKIDREDMKECIASWGVGLDEKYLSRIVDDFDNGDGILDYKTFLRNLRGVINEKKISFLEDVYNELQMSSQITSTSIPLDVFIKAINVDQHPLAYFGGYNTADVTAHLSDVFFNKKRKDEEQMVSRVDFIDYFSDIAAVIDDVEYFEGTIRNILQI
jgi:hypothetical protein